MIKQEPASTVYLVAVDSTEIAAHALEVACGLGAALGGNAELHLVHVLEPIPAPVVLGAGPAISPVDLLDVGRAVLDRAVADAARRFSGRICSHVVAGVPWREITQLASNLRADLVVVGTAGRTGLARMTLGSVAEKVVRHAGCPVLVVRPKDHHAQAEPGIEPPCDDCLKVQTETARQKLWCARHAERHPQGRVHYELPPSFAVGSMNFRP